MGSTSIQLNVKNNCRGGEDMSLNSKSLEKGAYWETDPPTTIVSGSVATFEAKNNSGKTDGKVVYILSDNSTTLTISFGIKHGSHHNDGGATLGGESPNNYEAGETDSTYATPASFPSSENDPKTYWLIEDAS